jgi:hypothetical protein
LPKFEAITHGRDDAPPKAVECCKFADRFLLLCREVVEARTNAVVLIVAAQS